MTLAERWRAALSELTVRHPDDRRTVLLDVTDGAPPLLVVHVTNTPCTVSGDIKADFYVSTLNLRCWPGVRLAQIWAAAAWAAYIQHEALELVSFHDVARRPLDPHEPGGEWDRALRLGLPVDLTMESLEASLACVMPRSKARALCQESVLASEHG